MQRKAEIYCSFLSTQLTYSCLDWFDFPLSLCYFPTKALYSPSQRKCNGVAVLADGEVDVRGKGVPLEHVDDRLQPSCLQEVATEQLRRGLVLLHLGGHQTAAQSLGREGLKLKLCQEGIGQLIN